MFKKLTVFGEDQYPQGQVALNFRFLCTMNALRKHDSYFNTLMKC